MNAITNLSSFAEIGTDRTAVERLQVELLKLPQYEPKTKNYFHGGMYCREVWRDGGVLVVGKVHRKEHFYLIVSGTVSINGAEPVSGPMLIFSNPGTKRAILSITPALCMTFHRTDSITVEDAENELVEEDNLSGYAIGNALKSNMNSLEQP